MKILNGIALLLISLSSFAQGAYAPAHDQEGTTAIHKDSSVFKGWATSCSVIRGLKDIAKPNSDTTSIGFDHSATAKADGHLVVSLGDGGEAVLTFDGTLYNGVGPDFAVFENSFSSTFLELAFVEVSSDGINFFRFPSQSLTDTVVPVGGFGSVNASDVHNLAGKYRSNYGTPFDLDDLAGTTGLDVQKVTHVKIIDVIGTLDSAYASRDSHGRKINDPYPTPFNSGGFDLDAVGAIHMSTVGIAENSIESLNLYPNPCIDYLKVDEEWNRSDYEIIDSRGQLLQMGQVIQGRIDLKLDTKGIYFIHLKGEGKQARAKFFKQ